MFGDPPEADRTPIFSEIFYKHGVTDGRYKLIRDEGTGDVRLYDLASDPHEKRNLVGKRPELVHHFTKLLRQRRAEAREREADYEVDEQMREMLRELGYTDDAPAN